MPKRVVSENWIAANGYLRARVRVLQRDDLEGRSKPIWTGYRAAWHFGERNSDGLLVMHDAPLELEDADTIEPGAEAAARLYPLRPELWEAIAPGALISMHEGARKVGEATVVARVEPTADSA